MSFDIAREAETLAGYHRIGVVGLGQIGSSLAYGLRERCEVVGYDIEMQARDEMARAGFAVVPSLEKLLGSVELCFFAIPAGALKAMLPKVFDLLVDSNVVIADLCSTKLDIEEALLALGIHAAGIRYVGLHPLAGNERQGSRGAELDLFRERTMVVSSGIASDAPSAVAVAALLVSAIGCRAIFVNPALHDRITNFTIQLPHIFAYLTSSFAKSVQDHTLLSLLSGNSFGDVTRVAKSSPEMVASFLFANREILMQSLHQLDAKLAALTDALEEPNESSLVDLLRDYAPEGEEIYFETFVESRILRSKVDFEDVIRALEERRVLVESIHLEQNLLQVSGRQARRAED